MSDIILAYIPCKSVDQAREIGMHLLKLRLAACINILPEMYSSYFWPAKSEIIEESREVVLIAKTTEKHFNDVVTEVEAKHTYETPCIIGIPTKYINDKYYQWLLSELK
jgi:periplasmic divalent cation tolerance protein